MNRNTDFSDLMNPTTLDDLSDIEKKVVYYIKAYNADDEKDESLYYFFSNGVIKTELTAGHYMHKLKNEISFEKIHEADHKRSLSNPLTIEEAEKYDY